MSSRLTFEFEEIEIKPQIAERIRKEFDEEFGHVTTIPVAVQAKRRDGSWVTTEAYFDTGAGISLFSQEVAKQARVEKFIPHELSGIAMKEECKVPVRISKITVRLVDMEGNVGPELPIWAAFAEQPVPQVIGMKNIIDRFKLESDPSKKRFYLTPLF